MNFSGNTPLYTVLQLTELNLVVVALLVTSGGAGGTLRCPSSYLLCRVMIITKAPLRASDLCVPNRSPMEPNMGNMDRIIRSLLAVVIAVLYFAGIINGTVGIVLLVLAAVFLLTSLVRFCPLYKPLGINTCAR